MLRGIFKSKNYLLKEIREKEEKFERLEEVISNFSGLLEEISNRDKYVTKAKTELENIFDNITEYVIIVDCNDLITRINKPAAALINKNPSEIIHTHISEQFRDFSNLLDDVYECQESHKPVERTFYSEQFGKYFSCNIRKIINAEQDLICINIYNDVTKQVKMERKINDISEVLYSSKSESDKLEYIKNTIEQE